MRFENTFVRITQKPVYIDEKFVNGTNTSRDYFVPLDKLIVILISSDVYRRSTVDYRKWYTHHDFFLLRHDVMNCNRMFCTSFDAMKSFERRQTHLVIVFSVEYPLKNPTQVTRRISQTLTKYFLSDIDEHLEKTRRFSLTHISFRGTARHVFFCAQRKTFLLKFFV